MEGGVKTIIGWSKEPELSLSLETNIGKIGDYKVIQKINESTREIFLVEKGGKRFVIKTLTHEHNEMRDDYYLPMDVQEQIDNELERWEELEHLGILNPIIEVGNDYNQLNTQFIVLPYIKTLLGEDSTLAEQYKSQVEEKASIVFNNLEELDLVIDDITWEEISKISSWGINEEGKLVLLDYGV